MTWSKVLSRLMSPLGAVAVAAALATAGASSASAQGRDPVGETASYKVDRASSRTSSFVRSGDMQAEVVRYLPDETPPAYETTIDYSLNTIVGRRSGTVRLPVEEAYFTPEFLEMLRQNGEYTSPHFKLRHMGYADARNMDGGVYPQCDKVLIYDLDVRYTSELPIAKLAQALVGNDRGEVLEDMEILAHIYPGVPVIGAVKLDVTGKYQGQNVKAGADYEMP
jgi:hypothetical protein